MASQNDNAHSGILDTLSHIKDTVVEKVSEFVNPGGQPNKITMEKAVDSKDEVVRHTAVLKDKLQHELKGEEVSCCLASDLKDQALHSKDPIVRHTAELKDKAIHEAIKDKHTLASNEGVASDLLHKTMEKASELKEMATEKASELKERVTEKVSDLKDKIVEKAQDTKSTIVEQAQNLKEKVLPETTLNVTQDKALSSNDPVVKHTAHLKENMQHELKGEQFTKGYILDEKEEALHSNDPLTKRSAELKDKAIHEAACTSINSLRRSSIGSGQEFKGSDFLDISHDQALSSNDPIIKHTAELKERVQQEAISGRQQRQFQQSQQSGQKLSYAEAVKENIKKQTLGA